MAGTAAPELLRHQQIRPMLWRLPLVAFVLTGLTCLWYLDRLLVREYRQEGATQAAQADALLEGFMTQRIAFLNSIQLLTASAPTSAEAADRFRTVARELGTSAPDVLSLYLLDAAGVVQATYPDSLAARVGGNRNHAAIPARNVALREAATSRQVAMTTTLELRDGRRGMIVYDPILRGGHIAGYVGGAFAYHALFHDALAGQLQGAFAYRVLDDDSTLIAQSEVVPTDVADVVEREVSLPAGHHWLLQVEIPRYQPLLARLITWLVGILLLLLVILLVVREEARAERIAQHSFQLELLSRDVLDANVRLEERAQQVAGANRAKSRFLANVSHELRTPLNAIVGYNSLALDGVYGELPSPLRAAHERIGAAARHLLGLVDDVLDLSKIEVGRMDVCVEPVDVDAMLDGVVTVIDPIAAAKGLRIDVVSSRNLPRLTTDPRHVRQILLNLVSNAVKFTERGSIALVARRDDADPQRRITIAVQDTGSGISLSDLDRIFEEFEQVRPSGRGDSMQRGTGLGLTISRKLARLLGGEIAVESTMGSGSRFTLTLPIGGDALAASSANDESSGAHRPSPALDAERAESGEHAAIAAGALGTSRRGGGLDDATTHG
jgi:signal transduction histidine kinase